MSLYVPPGQRSAGVLKGMPRWREVRPKSDFEIMIEKIKDTPMYQVIKSDLEPYESWRYDPRQGAGSNGRDKRIPLNEDGVQLFLFNDPIYRDDFFKIIDKYRSFYGLSSNEMRNKEYRIKRNREKNIINESNEKIERVLNERINGFEDCLHVGNGYYGSIEEQQAILEYMNRQGRRERKIRDLFDFWKRSIMESTDFDDHDKMDLLERLRKQKISMLAERIMYGPKNKPFSTNLSECSTIMTPELEILINRYVIPQGKKVLLLGNTTKLLTMQACSQLFQVLVGIPVWTIKPSEKVCNKHIIWTLFLNRMYLVISMTKKMNIPMIFYLPSGDKKIFQKTSKKKSVQEIKQNQFIGIIQIPIYSNMKDRIIRYEYIFIFESQKVSKDYYDPNFISHYQLLNQNLDKLAIGTNRLRTTVTYDELDAIYYMTTVYSNPTHPMKEYRVYLYRDSNIPDFMFISTKPNLTDKRLYPDYNLKNVYMNIWREDGYRKQFIFYTDETKVSIQQKLQQNEIKGFTNMNGRPKFLFITSNHFDP